MKRAASREADALSMIFVSYLIGLFEDVGVVRREECGAIRSGSAFIGSKDRAASFRRRSGQELGRGENDPVNSTPLPLIATSVIRNTGRRPGC